MVTYNTNKNSILARCVWVELALQLIDMFVQILLPSQPSTRMNRKRNIKIEEHEQQIISKEYWHRITPAADMSKRRLSTVPCCLLICAAVSLVIVTILLWVCVPIQSYIDPSKTRNGIFFLRKDEWDVRCLLDFFSLGRCAMLTRILKAVFSRNLQFLVWQIDSVHYT